MLPAQHLMDMGYVDAEVLAESQSRYAVDIVGPVMPDTSFLSLTLFWRCGRSKI